MPCFTEKMRLEKYEKLVCNFYDKNEYVARNKTFKTSINWIILRKVA